MKFRIFFITLLFMFLYGFSQAQEKDSTLLTIDRIFNSDEFYGEGFGPAKWLADGSGYTTLEYSKDTLGGLDIIKYNPETGEKEVLVSASKLIPNNTKSPLMIDNYKWSPDGKILLIYTNTARVWRYNTKGDYWTYNLQTGELYKLGGNAKPSTLMFAKFSPDENKIGYLRENNIYVENLSDHNITQLTFDGSKNVTNGTFDWVYEEEFDCRDGFRWSPDSKSIAFWKLDATDVKNFYMINNTDSLYPRIIPVQYPKVGTTLSICKLGVVNINEGKTRWLNIPGDERNNYITRMEWAANSDEIIFQRMNRHQNLIEVNLGDVNTGIVKTILTERDSAWLDVVDDWRFIKDGKFFIWLSERDGWKHIYMASREGDKLDLISKCDFDIQNILSINEKSGWIYFIASPENPAQRYLYRVKIKPQSKPERITPTDQPGTHSYDISADCKWAFHSFSTFDKPPITELITLPDHDVKRNITTNSKLNSKLKSIRHIPADFFRIDIGNNIKLDGWIIKPFNFDSTKKYPVLFYVYGEPAAQTVLDSWNGSNYLWHQMLAQQGYIIISIDNRGTPAPRGREWRKCIYKKIGVISSTDQASAAKAIINKWKFVDPERIGMWGWSGGGSMSLNAIFRYPDLYKTAMAVAAVSDVRYYDAVYQERYVGLLDENPQAYKDCSPITFANQLKGNLLIVHGTGDDNVHYQNAEALINKLIENNKKFTMMAYPNRTHGIYEGRNTTIHLYELLTGYLKKNLPKEAIAR